MFHKIKKVECLDDYKLMVSFIDGKEKEYDIKPLFKKWEDFRELKKNNLFYQVKVDPGGHGISWNERIDLSSEEIWGNGVEK